jgi:uncharacterized protein (DUF433 family)
MSLPPVRIPHPHVFLDETGSPLIEGTRVPVRRLFSWHRQGTTVETLLRRYPQLGPARIFDALAFAYDNLDLVTADLVREREALARETEIREEAAPQDKKQRAAAAAASQGKLPFEK